eukprot:scaffold237393_cov35-Tisochrysis_lutea.AAC.2
MDCVQVRSWMIGVGRRMLYEGCEGSVHYKGGGAAQKSPRVNLAQGTSAVVMGEQPRQLLAAL